ncbi:MAG: glycoside hydrolase family 32 protein [Bacteroidota bacterium]
MRFLIPYLLVFLSCFFACTSDMPMNKNLPKTNSDYRAESHRPLFHFTPDSMWMNDPNGMVYYEGEYHLFYQYYPDSTVWGPMHWGHTISKDLVHWERLPIALYPDSLGYIFSGSAVVDWKNTSGFGVDDNPPMIAIFTHHLAEGEKAGANDFQYQSIAYSNDRGRTWTKYAENPVLKNPGIKDFRDPKVIWHEASEKWIMVLAAFDRIKIYSSTNLKSWTFESDFGEGFGAQGRPWECPDLFPLLVEDTDETKWVMLVSIGKGASNGGSGTQYFVGDFDGKTFTSDYPPEQTLWVDWGKDNYAGVTWSDVPAQLGERIFIAWMSNWQYAQKVPSERWRSAMTIPRSLTLRSTESGVRLFSNAVSGLESLRKSSHTIELGDRPMRLPSLAELDLTFDNAVEEDILLRLSNNLGESIIFGYDARVESFFVNRNNAGKMDFSEDFGGKHYAERLLKDEIIKMHIFIDRSSIEILADEGATNLTELFFPSKDFTQLEIATYADLTAGTLYELSSIWND